MSTFNNVFYCSLILGLLTSYSMAIETNPQLFASQIQEHFANYQRTVITYQGIGYAPPLPEYATEQKQQYLADLAKLKMVFEKRKNGSLSDTEAKQWEKVSDESLLNDIQFIENTLNGFQFDFLKVLSTNGRECRIDVFRPDGHPAHHYYLFDGLSGYLVTEDDNVVRTALSFTLNWLQPTNWVQYGFGIDRYLRLGYHITQVDTEKRTYIISNPEWKDIEYEFILANEHDLYWQQCDRLINGNIVKRIVCEDFEEHDGLWIPKTVRRYRFFGNVSFLQEEMTLQEVSVNPGTMEEGLFATPDASSMNVRHLNR